MVLHCRWPGVRLWFWSWRWLCVLISSSGLSSPTGGGRHRRSCRASRSWSHRLRAVQSRSMTSRASPSPPAPVCRRPRIWRQCVAPVGQLVREEAAEVRLSPAGPAPTDGPPGPRPRADVREARPSFSPGRPGGRRLSQPLLVWAGPLREPVEPPAVRPRRVVSARGACSPSGPHSEGGMGPGGRYGGPGSSAGSLPRDGPGAGFGGLAGAGLSVCWSSPRESRCPRGGIAWAGVPAASATA